MRVDRSRDRLQIEAKSRIAKRQRRYRFIMRSLESRLGFMPVDSGTVSFHANDR
jgi:hypothetical protein